MPEIGGQAEALAAAWGHLAQQQQDWVDAYMANAEFEEVVFIGSGSSYYQAQVMATTFKAWLGRSASALPSSDIFLIRNQSVARNRKVLLVGVSRSGESTEVILAINAVKDEPDWTVCGITCYADSTLGQIAPCLVSPLGQEKSTVMTKSFSSMTFMMQAAIAWAAAAKTADNSLAAAGAGYIADLEAVRDSHGELVAKAQAFAEQFASAHEFSKFIYLGLGAYFGIAEEVGLKLKEMSYVWTESYGTLEFRHGPKSIVEPGTLVCLLLSEQARSYELKVAEEMQAYGATVLIVTAAAGEDTAFADAVFEVGGAELSDEARAVKYLPLLQYFGFYTAINRGVDPDNPRNLTQVVKI